jgi:pyrroline-5-carboxylate reductase
MTHPTIALIGCGNMGRSIAGGLVRAGWEPGRIAAVDPEPSQRRRFYEDTGLHAGTDGAVAVAQADVVVLAVKPQSMARTVGGLAAPLRARRPLVISVAAGIPMAAIARWAGAALPVVRAMPNTPALLGAGATGLCAAPEVDDVQRELAARVLGATGIVQWVDDEAQLDVVTALSGSGPAYFFLLIEALIDAAIARGLAPEQARALAVHTALGAARMAVADAADPAELRRQVTSPGGTTERALRVLEDGGVRDLVARAVAAAQARAAELAREFGDGGP